MANDGSIYIHIIEDDQRSTLLDKRRAFSVPRAGDEIRMGGPDNERYYKVTRVVWVYDEPECPFERVNVGVSCITK